MSNLINPMENISLDPNDKSENGMKIQNVSRTFYDRLLTKDPRTIYCLDTGEIYIGDVPAVPKRERMKPHQRYLYIRKVSSIPEYVIVEDGGKGVLEEICSYADPQVALDYLARTSISSKPDNMTAEILEGITQILKNHREHTEDLPKEDFFWNYSFMRRDAIFNIMMLICDVENMKNIAMDFQNIMYEKYRDLIDPNKFFRGNRYPDRFLGNNVGFQIYSVIWNYLEKVNFEKERFFEEKEKEEWIKSISNGLYTALLKFFTPQ